MEEQLLGFHLIIQVVNYVPYVDIKTLSLRVSTLGNGLALNVGLFMIEI